MGVFRDILRSDESLFANEDALDYSYMPKLIPFREREQKTVARLMAPLLNKQRGKNAFIYGAPGVGKTLALKKIFEELQEESDSVYRIYINCWKANTTYQIISEICQQIGYSLTGNKTRDELMTVIKNVLVRNQNPSVLVFDEADKLNDYDFLYLLLEELPLKSVILITNYRSLLDDLDKRVISRLVPEVIKFEEYKQNEVFEILKERARYAFVPTVIDEKVISIVSKRTFELKDIRTGLFLLKEAGTIAESRSSRKVTEEDVIVALKKFDDFSFKANQDFDNEDNMIMNVVKENSGKKIGDLYDIYAKKNKGISYKVFAKKITYLDESGCITTKKTKGGKEGNTTFVEYSVEKKLSDFV